MLDEIPEGFLLDSDAKIQTIKRLMQLKKVNPDQMSILSQSSIKSDHEEEVESLITGDNFNEHGQMKVGGAS